MDNAASFIALILAAVVFVVTLLFNRNRTEEDDTSDFIDKERTLETQSPDSLVDSSPRADALRDEQRTIADNAKERTRERIRDRLKRHVSGLSGGGASQDSTGGSSDGH